MQVEQFPVWMWRNSRPFLMLLTPNWHCFSGSVHSFNTR